MLKRRLAMLLSIVMLITLLPVATTAVEPETITMIGQDYIFDEKVGAVEMDHGNTGAVILRYNLDPEAPLATAVYRFNVQTAGIYQLTINYQKRYGGNHAISYTVNGSNPTDVAVAKCEDEWKDAVLSNSVELKTGENVLTFTNISDKDFRIAGITLTLLEAGGSLPPVQVDDIVIPGQSHNADLKVGAVDPDNENDAVILRYNVNNPELLSQATYQFNVERAGTYKLTINYQKRYGGTHAISFAVNGGSFANVSVAKCEAEWKDAELSGGIELAAGENILTFANTSDKDFRIKSITLSWADGAAVEPPATEPPATEPPATEPPATQPPVQVGDIVIPGQSHNADLKVGAVDMDNENGALILRYNVNNPELLSQATYQFNVETAGTYKLTINYQKRYGGTHAISFAVNGGNFTDVGVAKCEAEWKDADLSDSIQLAAGANSLTFANISDKDFRIKSITLTLVSGGTVEPPVTEPPVQVEDVVIPGQSHNADLKVGAVDMDNENGALILRYNVNNPELLSQATYEFNLAQGGTYKLTINYQKRYGGTHAISFAANGGNFTDVAVAKCEAEWKDAELSGGIELAAGDNTLTFANISDKDFRIKSITLTLVSGGTVEPPATEPPATEPPATEPPATEPPATEPPATEPPATVPPVQSSDTILMGTPVVDGKLDGIYKSSYKVVVDHTMAFNVPVASPDNIKAQVYFLHDGTYLYVAAVVTGDSAVVNTGLKSWVADSVEIWFSNPTGDSSKIVMDAFATPWPHKATNNKENKLNIDLFEVEMAAVQTTGGYTVEMKVEIPYYRKSEGSLAINVQLNNTYAADSDASNWDVRNGGCYGTQPAKHSPIYVDLSDKAAVEPGPGVLPSGGDSSFVAVAVAMMAISVLGIAVVTGKKKEF